MEFAANIMSLEATPTPCSLSYE